AMGYLWDKSQGKASQEAMRSFSDGAAWAFELLSGNELGTKINEESEAEYEIGNNERERV
ncbi:MAG: hypothetical protein WHU54_09680, partial [Candidatus Bathyarchaeia archaeon]